MSNTSWQSYDLMEELSTKMYPLNQLLDQLHTIGLHSYVKLPSIVVVGDQSSGKSSVLESLVGEDILPKAATLATKTPVRLRLVREKTTTSTTTTTTTTQNSTYAIVKHPGSPAGMRYTMAGLAAGIKLAMDVVAGEGNSIVSTPVDVEIHSATVPELTLVDLPGIVKVPLPGHPETIEQDTKNIIDEYIKDPESIILAIVPANIDPATSEALKVAMSYDKHGDRTIGVLTKADIMDLGTNVAAVLHGEFRPLNLGYVAMKNRSKSDIQNGKTVRESIEDEGKFFSEHDTYKTMDPFLFGAVSLSVKLMNVLRVKIEKSLPDIYKHAVERSEQVSKMLVEMGGAIPTDLLGQQRIIFNYIKQYTDGIRGMMEGNFELLPNIFRNRFMEEKLFGAAQIRSIFVNNYASSVQAITVRDIPDETIKRVLTNTMGNKLPDFLPFSAFKIFLIPHMQRVLPLAIKCVSDIHQYFLRIANELSEHIFKNLPVFQDKVSTITATIMSNLKRKTEKKVTGVLEMQHYIFTENSQYLANSRTHDFKIYNEVEDLKQKLNAYFEYVFKPTIKDLIPQAIGTFLLFRLNQSLELALMSLISNTAGYSSLIEQPLEISRKRDLLSHEFEVLSNASFILENFKLH